MGGTVVSSTVASKVVVVFRARLRGGWWSIWKHLWERNTDKEKESREKERVMVESVERSLRRRCMVKEAVESVITGGFRFENSTVTFVRRVPWFPQWPIPSSLRFLSFSLSLHIYSFLSLFFSSYSFLLLLSTPTFSVLWNVLVRNQTVKYRWQTTKVIARHLRETFENR